MLRKLFANLDGYKTYGTAALAVAGAIAGLSAGIIDPGTALSIIVAAGGLVGLGHKADKTRSLFEELLKLLEAVEGPQDPNAPAATLSMKRKDAA